MQNTKKPAFILYQITAVTEDGSPEEFKRIIGFTDKSDMIDYFAKQIRTDGYTDPSRWYMPFLTRLNYSYKDKYVYDEFTGMQLYRDLIVLNSDDKIIDIRNDMPALIKYKEYLLERSRTVNPDKQHHRERIKYLERRKIYKRNHKRIKRHTHWDWRAVHKAHTMRYGLGPEYKEFHKPKDKRFMITCCEDYVTRKSSGWKNKKITRQWQAHNINKKRIADKLTRNELSEQAYLASIDADINILDTIE